MAVRLASFALAVWLAPAAVALPVADFALADQAGNPHRLSAYADAKAIVFMVQGNGCPVVRNALPDLREARARFQERGVAFLMINANLQDGAESIRAEAEEFGIDFPILVDESQAVGERLALTRTAEVLVLDAAREIAYRGPINDRLAYERQRKAARRHYLADALDAVLAGRTPAVRSKMAIGCLIHFPDRGEPAEAPGHAH